MDPLPVLSGKLWREVRGRIVNLIGLTWIKLLLISMMCVIVNCGGFRDKAMKGGSDGTE